MALTLESEQRLKAVGLIEFFEADEAIWSAVVADTLSFTQRNFPAGATVRRDDVAKALVPILEVHEEFQAFRDRERLTPKYWNRDFADLLIDRTWHVVTNQP